MIHRVMLKSVLAFVALIKLVERMITTDWSRIVSQRR